MRIAISAAITGALLLPTLTIFSQPLPHLSPVPENPQVLARNTAPHSSKKTIGFFPYWNLSDEKYQRYHLLTQVIFFALQVERDGSIRKLLDDKTEEPGWTAYKSQAFGMIFRKAKQSGTKVLVSVQSLEPEVIEAVVNDPQKRQRLVTDLRSLVQQKNLDGVNIDFEYSGTPSQSTIHNFTRLVEEVGTALKAVNHNLIVSVDVFADTMQKIRLWDMPLLTRYVDEVIIMAYDFHRPSSPIAGPIAPLRGSPDRYSYDIIHTLKDFSAAVPLEKIILGVAYYGYEWQTVSDETSAKTYPGSGALATYKRVRSLIDEKRPKLVWDEVALAPTLSYEEGGKRFRVYYENEVSLGLKYDLVNESGIAGIAIWALGYDGPYSNLWNVLEEKLFSKRSTL